MELIKLTKKMLERVNQRIDDYIDNLYLDASKLSGAKLDFLGEVRNFINTNNGISIANPERWVESIGGATQATLGGIKARYYAAAQIDFGWDLEKFLTCCNDMEAYGMDSSSIDYITDLVNSNELPLRILQEISAMLNEYNADWWRTRDERGRFDYYDWAVALEEMIQKVKDVVDSVGYDPDASKVENEIDTTGMTLEEMGLEW